MNMNTNTSYDFDNDGLTMEQHLSEIQETELNRLYPNWIMVGCDSTTSRYFKEGDKISVTTDGDANGDDITLKWGGNTWNVVNY